MNTLNLSSIWCQKKYHWTNEITMSKFLAFSPRPKLYVWKHVNVTIEISRRTLSLFLSVIKLQLQYKLLYFWCKPHPFSLLTAGTWYVVWSQMGFFPEFHFQSSSQTDIRMLVASSHSHSNRSQMIRLVSHNTSCYRQKTEQEIERAKSRLNARQLKSVSRNMTMNIENMRKRTWPLLWMECFHVVALMLNAVRCRLMFTHMK